MTFQGPLAVRLEGIEKRFPRTVACDRASLAVKRGEVHALVGENGAGKSTLMQILYGLVRPEAGTIEVLGRRLERHTPRDAIAAGLGMVFQHFKLVPTLTVAENVVLGREPRRGLFFDRARAEAEVQETSERFGLPVDPRARVESLTVGMQQRVELLKVLFRGAEAVVLDEPTAVLTPQEADALIAVVRGLAEAGKSVVIVTHKLREVMAVADRITVMRRGKTLDTTEASATTASAVAAKMIGRAPSALPKRAASTVEGPPLLEVRGLSARAAQGGLALSGLNLSLRRGEILGLAGVEGNGQSELVDCLVGLRTPTSGELRFEGRPLVGGPRARLEAGIAHVPEDRLKRAVVLEMSVAENAILGAESAFSGPLGLDRRRILAHAHALIERTEVRPPEPEARLGALSGGNQQKVVVARELARNPKLLVAAHPTRGLDLGAVERIQRALLDARAAGTAVLLVSAELEELLAISDRVAVIAGGRIVGEVDPGEVDERTLGLWMTSSIKAESAR